jgi:hypothetical protein
MSRGKVRMAEEIARDEELAVRILSGELVLTEWQNDLLLRNEHNLTTAASLAALKIAKGKRAFLKRLDNNVKR